jgi:hypothetical protein
LQAEIAVRIPIRRISIVVDLSDPFAPELSLEDFRRLFGHDPQEGRFRIVTIELITSPDDMQPMLVTECARYSRFIRRESDDIYFRKELSAP